MFLIYTKHFITDINSCFTEKSTKIKTFKKEQNDLNKTQVTEKTLMDCSSVYKFLCLTPKFNQFSIKLISECVKTEKKVGNIQNFDNQVSSSSKFVGKFL